MNARLLTGHTIAHLSFTHTHTHIRTRMQVGPTSSRVSLRLRAGVWELGSDITPCVTTGSIPPLAGPQLPSLILGLSDLQDPF